MKVKSIKFNVAINLLRTSLNFLFPLITFPYVSRILSTDGIGKIAFAESVIGYFSLFAMLGIPLYGTREIARVRNSKSELTQTTIELFIINIISTLIIYILFFVTVFLSNKLLEYKILLFIMSISLVLNTMGVEWFYQGIEDFTYITIRSIVFKVLSVCIMFLLIKQKSDYILWGCIGTFAAGGANILNIFRLRKYIDIRSRVKLNFRRHIKPVLTIFGFNLITSLYLNLNTLMLGYLSNDHTLGLYTAAIKINRIVLVLIASLGNVLLPRMSYFLAKEMMQEYKRIAEKSISFILFIGLPSTIALYLLSYDIIEVFSGKLFMEARMAMQIITPIILLIGFSNFIGLQILYPNGKERIVIISVAFGAICSLFLNYLLIPIYHQNGAAIAIVCSELIVTFSMAIMGHKYLKFSFINKNNIKYLIASIMMGSFIYYLGFWKPYLSSFQRLIIIVPGGCLIYFTALGLLKESFINEGIRKIRIWKRLTI